MRSQSPHDECLPELKLPVEARGHGLFGTQQAARDGAGPWPTRIDISSREVGGESPPIAGRGGKCQVREYLA
jgi:hypothetical protein